MAKAPKCKLCGHEHWPSTQPHIWRDAPVTKGDAKVTPVVTTPSLRAARDAVVTVSRDAPVTYIASEQEMILAAVDPQHECPICGNLHRATPMTHAERQAEYRRRHQP